MSITTTVPITVSEEAAAQVAMLGMSVEFDQMLEHACRVLPGLQAIDVTLLEPCDPGDDPRVMLDARLGGGCAEYDPAEHAWMTWLFETFSPDVYRHFCLMTIFGDEHEG